MNAIGEFDLEMLEDYLDDALSPAQVQHVAQRLCDEPELALAMHELRAQHVLRAAAFRSMEPCEAKAVEVAERVANRVHRQERWRRTLRTLKLGSAVAAVLAIFIAGRLVHLSTSPARQDAHNPQPPVAPMQNAVAIGDASATFHVALVDRDGRVIPVQKFAKMDEARQFAQDLMQYESRRQEAQQGRAMLVSDRF